MAHFLLVHGASHGAWCWDRLGPLLEAMGHTVRAIDLPSHGDDPTPSESVTLGDYVSATLGALEADTVLVGHSLGGLSITLAAARAPEKIRALVYLCALVPVPGQSFADTRAASISPELSQALTVDREAGVSHVIPEKAADLFYHDCSEEDRAFAIARLSPQPIAVMNEDLDFSYPSVPYHYIRCLDDPVVMPSYQRAITKDWSHVHQMSCGHSPFFADPDGLANILDRIAAEPV